MNSLWRLGVTGFLFVQKSSEIPVKLGVCMTSADRCCANRKEIVPSLPGSGRTCLAAAPRMAARRIEAAVGLKRSKVGGLIAILSLRVSRTAPQSSADHSSPPYWQPVPSIHQKLGALQPRAEPTSSSRF
ncbi:hypothetical protein TGRUB_430550 [Toxoplasma gondii RUB]|uniref:Uncharacterized protein n=1 Tax=Toxoplasma gondii RUB TaxID=935652 RepID=A0A086M170_TOXGO|nr:hypothetical protein TGRUB_430550 [Toxoplasma gondii RUB]